MTFGTFVQGDLGLICIGVEKQSVLGHCKSVVKVTVGPISSTVSLFLSTEMD